MPELNFLVSGSAADPYEVTFLQTDNGISVLCTCKAGQNGQHCKHRISIMRGDVKGVIEPSAPDLESLAVWLANSALKKALDLVDTTEAAIKSAAGSDIATAKKKALAAKKALAQAMR